MLRCKQVARALADEYHRKLPWWRRFGLNAHVRLCVFCGKYHRNVQTLQDVMDSYVAHEDDGSPETGLELSAESRARIQEAIRSDR